MRILVRVGRFVGDGLGVGASVEAGVIVGVIVGAIIRVIVGVIVCVAKYNAGSADAALHPSIANIVIEDATRIHILVEFPSLVVISHLVCGLNVW